MRQPTRNYGAWPAIKAAERTPPRITRAPMRMSRRPSQRGVPRRTQEGMIHTLTRPITNTTDLFLTRPSRVKRMKMCRSQSSPARLMRPRSSGPGKGTERTPQGLTGLASMRPGPTAPEWRLEMLVAGCVEPASMRPGPTGPGMAGGEGGGVRLQRGFNEAGADWPRNASCADAARCPSPRFNEAGADWPRNGAVPRADFALALTLQ